MLRKSAQGAVVRRVLYIHVSAFIYTITIRSIKHLNYNSNTVLYLNERRITLSTSEKIKNENQFSEL
jgi:hypothetical protein